MKELTPELRQQLIEAFLDLPGIERVETRNQLLLHLPPRLIAVIARSDVPMIDVSNFISYAEKWGMGALNQLLNNAIQWASGGEPGRKLETLRLQVAKCICIFLSYKRQVDPDEEIAVQVFQALNPKHQVFIDQIMEIGTRWAERIEQELSEADYLISFLSVQSVQSEMLLAEVAHAHQLNKDQGHPVILPVRLAYQEPFQYPLSEYLDHLHWAVWSGPSDTTRLIADLQRAIAGGSLPTFTTPNVLQLTRPRSFPAAIAQPVVLELPDGAMDPDSAFYIERAADRSAQAIQYQGVTITIKGPRQMGKSSLLHRTLKSATEAGKSHVFLDFQLLEQSALANAETFLRQFCTWISYKLKIEDRVAKYWRLPLGNSQRCTNYMEEYLLRELDRPLVLAMDEVDRLFDTKFRSDFFGMLRSWHNSRHSVSVSVWKQLDLVLVTSTEPYQLIKNLSQSPFNVGQVLDLEDFTPEQVAELNRRHGGPLTAREEARLLTLIGGHPYLVRRALYLVASNQITSADLFATAAQDRGPFGDHLRNHLFRLRDKPELVAGLRRVLQGQPGLDEEVFSRLQGGGLVKREGLNIIPRCQLYTDYFKDRLRG